MEKTIRIIAYMSLFILVASACNNKDAAVVNNTIPSYIQNVLCKNLACTIAIDAKGNKWLGTQRGVLKFDGTNWYTYFTKYNLDGYPDW